ncbi:MAG: Fic family protein [Treponema sp.]|nr:Fic family protein [Treponema sp.]
MEDYSFINVSLDKLETVSILKAERDAVSALSELKGIANLIPNQSILINAVVLQESQDSSEIENIITTKDDLYKAVIETVSKTDSATKEVLFYREALYEGFAKVKQHGFISINDIIDIQTILVQSRQGFRTLPGTQLVNDRTNEVVYTPPQTKEQIENLMKSFTEYLNDSERSLAKLAVLHFQFESIHPFYDGNGRTGRIINVLYLILKNYLDIPILYLSSYIIKHKDEYYLRLQNVRKQADWENWTLFILKAIETTSIQTIEKVRKIKNLMDQTVKDVKEKCPKIYSKELVETLFENPYCKGEFIEKAVGVERKAAARYLHQLTAEGILECQKIAQTNIYINKKLMDILKTSGSMK